MEHALPKRKPEEIAAIFKAILAKQDKTPFLDLTHSLLVAVDMQWHTFQPLEPQLAKRVIKCLIRFWVPEPAGRTIMEEICKVFLVLNDIADLTEVKLLLEETVRKIDDKQLQEMLIDTLVHISATPRFKTTR